MADGLGSSIWTYEAHSGTYRRLAPPHSSQQRGRNANRCSRVRERPPLLAQIEKDLSLLQAVNVSMLPGIVGSSLAMPDIHQGYGFPIGGVAATDWETGVVSPGGVGFDINCGVRLLHTSLDRGAVQAQLTTLIDQVFRDVPCGVGGEGRVKLSPKQLDGSAPRRLPVVHF